MRDQSYEATLLIERLMAAPPITPSSAADAIVELAEIVRKLAKSFEDQQEYDREVRERT